MALPESRFQLVYPHRTDSPVNVADSENGKVTLSKNVFRPDVVVTACSLQILTNQKAVSTKEKPVFLQDGFERFSRWLQVKTQDYRESLTLFRLSLRAFELAGRRP